MVTCRCGCVFENSRWDSHVMCPQCKRIYPNEAPDMVHPATEEERSWTCAQCGAVNRNSDAGASQMRCADCGAKRPETPAKRFDR